MCLKDTLDWILVQGIKDHGALGQLELRGLFTINEIFVAYRK